MSEKQRKILSKMKNEGFNDKVWSLWGDFIRLKVIEVGRKHFSLFIFQAVLSNKNEFAASELWDLISGYIYG